jgi:hypothetical protein
MALALRELAQVDDWPRVRAKLLEIHRLSYDELTVIPLWQLSDHLAYHRDVQGIGSQAVTLYHNVEQWQSPPAVLSTTP